MFEAPYSGPDIWADFLPCPQHC